MKKRNIWQDMDGPIWPSSEEYLNCSATLKDGRKVFLEGYNPHTNLYSGLDEKGNRIYARPHEIENIPAGEDIENR